jgi:hypothetical protein
MFPTHKINGNFRIDKYLMVDTRTIGKNLAYNKIWLYPEGIKNTFEMYKLNSNYAKHSNLVWFLMHEG